MVRVRAFAAAATLLAAGALLSCGPGDDDAAPDTASRTVAGVEYAARSALLASYPVRVRTTVTATNVSSRDVLVRLPDECVVLVRALSRDGQPRWDQAGAATCPASARELRLAPGDSVRFDTEFTATDVLGDSLPDDVYVLHAYVRPDARDPVVLQAGRANLVVPR
jgi:hypothetical protein